MTIKAIKEKYKDYRIEFPEKNMFKVFDFKGDIGKAVIIVKSHPNKYVGKHVTQVVRVLDGKELLIDSMRPCDNMEDAIDVAAEMLENL